MGKVNRMHRRFLEKKGKEVMTDAAVKRAKEIALTETKRTLAWKRTGQFLIILTVGMAVAVCALSYAMYSLNETAIEAMKKCH